MTTTAQAPRWMVILLCVGLLCVAAAPALAQASNTDPEEPIGQQYRITAFPTYKLTEKTMGVGYLGWVTQPSQEYQSYYLASGVVHQTTPHVQLWAVLINVTTDYASKSKSDTLELRPFLGVKFMGENDRKWQYYNWTRWEIRYIDSWDTGQWTIYQRLRNQTRLQLPLTSAERAYTPKTFYAFADIEPTWRSDKNDIDPFRLRFSLAYIPNRRVAVEFQYYAQATHPNGGPLTYTDNIWRVNFKIATKKGLLSAIGDID